MGDQQASAPGKLRALPVDWIGLRLGVPADDPMLRDQPSSSMLLDRLEQSGRQEAALCLAAHALPPREAVWWACMCARHTLTELDRAATDRLALAAAETWVRRPDQPARARAFQAARQARFRSPEAMAAMGAFWTRTPQDDPTRAQIGRCIESALRLACLHAPAAAHPPLRQAFLRSARDIAIGGAGRLPAPTSAHTPSSKDGPET